MLAPVQRSRRQPKIGRRALSRSPRASAHNPSNRHPAGGKGQPPLEDPLHARAVRHFNSAHSSEINELAALARRALAEAGRGNALHETRLVALSNAKSTNKRETTVQTDTHMQNLVRAFSPQLETIPTCIRHVSNDWYTSIRAPSID